MYSVHTVHVQFCIHCFVYFYLFTFPVFILRVHLCISFLLISLYHSICTTLFAAVTLFPIVGLIKDYIIF